MKCAQREEGWQRARARMGTGGQAGLEAGAVPRWRAHNFGSHNKYVYTRVGVGVWHRHSVFTRTVFMRSHLFVWVAILYPTKHSIPRLARSSRYYPIHLLYRAYIYSSILRSTYMYF